LEDESGLRVDYRREGAILLHPAEEVPCSGARPLPARELKQLEPNLNVPQTSAVFVPEASVDPRQLIAAALKAAKHRGIELASGATVVGIDVVGEIVAGVHTDKTRFAGRVVVNCAGAWAKQIPPLEVPTRPVKGQMLAVAVPIVHDAHGSPSSPRILRHVVRSSEVYLVPRSDGRIVIGSTLEDAGYDKRVDSTVIHRLRQAAAQLLPELAQARMLESWAGLRPGTPDGLPILGATTIENYFVATGHYRDGILLAPITAHLMAHLVRGLDPELDISAFALSRFA
jgi:glycine oxidase